MPGEARYSIMIHVGRDARSGKMQCLPKRTCLTAVFLTVGVMSVLSSQPRAADQQSGGGKTSGNWADVIGDRLFPSWVEKRVQELQVTPAERRMDEIGWAKDIRDALRLAKKHERPIFLFTHLGRMAIGRC
jgi:hypothetical protein